MKTKQVKRQEADVRNAKYKALSTQQKVDALDARLGVGIGATKERDELDYDLVCEAEYNAQSL